MTKQYINRLFCFVLAALFWQCAGSEKPGLVGRLYHNTTALYNAYYLGSVRLTEVEAKITAATPKDYNRILDLFPSTDTTFTAPFRPQLEEVIKKASFAIKKHPQSRWTADSYILVGKARYYLGDFEEAIKTFKFVNTASKNNQVRFRAQVWLMRTFIAAKDYESADAVSALLKRVDLNKNNALHLFLNRAHYALLQQDTTHVFNNLQLAIPLIEDKDYLARVRFILAQLYQETGQRKPAYDIYSKILKRNPPYELGFYSKLNLGQVTELSNTNDKERIEKYYSKLLKDAKNIDFRDKIYYEMARFALKQQQYEPALAYLKQATKASTTNATQKAYAYLLTGKIYYENLQKYRLASSYYDSAVQILPPSSAEYAATAERRDVLQEFASQYTIIETQDSLQALARLDSASLNKRLAGILAAVEKQKVEEQQRQATAGASQNAAFSSAPNTRNPGQSNLTASTNSRGVWYFDNPASVSRARSEFVRRWGNRQLQDNWRVSDQEASPLAQGPAATTTNPATSEVAPPANSAAARQALLQDIPLGAERLRASNAQVEQALFNLATIYKQQLNEPARATEVYEKLLQRFPATKHKSEVYYSLYLIHQQGKDERAKTYANLIKREFPGTKYARLIDQPDYLKQVSANNQKARQLYDSAFANYHREKFSTATTLVNQVQKQYPDNELTDRVAFLDVLISGRTQKPAMFKTNIQQFIRQYPASPLVPKAEELLTAFAAFESGKLSEAEFNRTHPQVTKAPAVSAPEPIAEMDPVTEEAPAPTPTKRPARPQSKPRNPAPGSRQPAAVTPLDTAAIQPGTTTPAPSNTAAAPTTTAPPAAKAAGVPAPLPVEAKPKYAVNLALPHVVVVAYPKNNPAFKDIFMKMTAYNSKYNQLEKLTIDTASFSAATSLLIIKEFDAGKKAINYATKQKAPQSPLSKIRGIEFATFAISSENLPVLLQEGKLEEYITFYKNNYF